MDINIVVTGFARDRFSAGHLILVGHANGLVDRGHTVRFVPTIPSYRPRWTEVRAEIVNPPRPGPLRAGVQGVRALAGIRAGHRSRASLSRSLNDLARVVTPRADVSYQRASMLDRLRAVVPPADVTLATGFATALPVALYGTGVCGYFLQHYEVLFAEDLKDPYLARAEAALSYELPLRHVANSSWLRETVARRHGRQGTPLVLNAIDHSVYYPDGAPPSARPRVVSYSGRGVRWKGFLEAAQAVRLARVRFPDLEWWVFGDHAELAPDNEVAPYRDMGFQRPEELRQVYSSAHVALCPSWYESFPLYPLEAMACGCAVVSTPLGAEDFLRDGENALIAPPRRPDLLAERLVELLGDQATAARLRCQGLEDAARFTWTRSVDQMEEALAELVDLGPLPNPAFTDLSGLLP